MRVLSIFGTRPEAVKMAPVVRALAATPGIESLVCVTAQHREMLDQVLALFQIRPDVDLNLMKPNQSLSALSAAIFEHLDPVLKDLQPDWVLAQGDTTTVMVASLVAYYNRVRFGHVEAGLRTGDKFQPFPEEMNRRVAGVVADLHFAPTEWSRQNLLKENVAAETILVTGNPVIDALRWAAGQPFDLAQLRPLGLDLVDVAASGKKLVLITAHRRENFGPPLQNICQAVRLLAAQYAGQAHFVYPVHLNPNVQQVAHATLGGLPNVSLLPPLDYLPMIQVMKRSALVLTDSGGLQEEAPGFGVPVLVMRETTERPEGVKAGTVRLVGTQVEAICRETSALLDDPQAYARMAQAANPYGDGYAAERIARALLSAKW